MVDEGEKDMSIVEHNVLEVYEVKDGALQECMMFVKKLSETSLCDLETERNNLNDLLTEAEKEVTKLKTSLKTANGNVEELSATVKSEKEQRLKVEELLLTAQATEGELRSKLKQSMESAAASQKLHQEKCDALTEAQEMIAKFTAEKNALQEELKTLQCLRSQDEEEANTIHQRLLKEQEKKLQIEEEHEEEVTQLKKELTELQKNLTLVKEQAAAELAQLRLKLDLEQKMNESLSNEADSCVDAIKAQLVRVTRENGEIQASKQSALHRLNAAEEEILTLRKKLTEEKQRREKLYQDNKVNIEEAKSQLQKKISENELLTIEKEEIEKKLDTLEEEKKKLLCNAAELQENMEAARCEVCSLQEELEALKVSHKVQGEHNEEPGYSWASRVDEEEDWEQKYRELEIEQETLQKQFTQVRKHRNRVLRENGGLRRQMSMAAAQLAVTNQKFQRQLQHFRTQLNMAEHLYREKMLECSILEVQIKHLLKSSPTAQQNYDYTNNSEDQGREYIARSIDFGRRHVGHDFPAPRSIPRPRDDSTRHVQHATRQQHSSKHVMQQKRVEVQPDTCISTAEQEGSCPDSRPVEYVALPVNSPAAPEPDLSV